MQLHVARRREGDVLRGAATRFRKRARREESHERPERDLDMRTRSARHRQAAPGLGHVEDDEDRDGAEQDARSAVATSVAPMAAMAASSGKIGWS